MSILLLNGRIFNIFFDDKVSLIQHKIFALSEKFNIHLVKSQQHFLIKSFYARIMAVRDFVQLDMLNNSIMLSSKEKFNIVSFLFYESNFCHYYNFTVTKNKWTSFSFKFFIIYSCCFSFLLRLSILPFLETNLDKSFFALRPYKSSFNNLLEIKDIVLNGSTKLWYLKLKIFHILNSISKLWFIRNFPLNKSFLIFCFAQKKNFLCKSFFFIIFSYLLKGLL